MYPPIESRLRVDSVLFVLKGYPRVSEYFVADEILRFERMGIKVSIVSFKGARESLRQEVNAKIRASVFVVPGVENLEKLRLVKRALLLNPIRLIRCLWQVFEDGLSLGWNESLTVFLAALWALDLVEPHQEKLELRSHFLHSPTQLAQYIATLVGLEFTASAHAKDIYTQPKDILSRRINRSKFTTTCTQHNFDYLKSLPGVQKDKLHLVFHGIDINKFTQTSKQMVPSRPHVDFISVGRLVKKKGHDRLLSVLAALKSEGFSFRWSLYGDGELREELKAQAHRLGLEDEVIFQGVCTHSEVIEGLKHSDIFLNSSRVCTDGDRDGIPNTLIEAMSMGLPVVSTNVSGIPELVTSYQNGILVDEEDEDAFKTALIELIENPTLAESLGKGARETVEASFDANVCFAPLREMYLVDAAEPKVPL